MTAPSSVGVRILAASLIGVATGLVVLALEHLVDDVLEEIFHGPVWLPAVMVLAGSVVTVFVVKLTSGGSSATTEVYVEEFHESEPTLEPRHAPGRLVAAFTTLASGAPLGMEGPAVYAGSSIATVVRRRWPALTAEAENAMLVAGAAAGIAAVFKAPAAGAIFALEVPYKGRLSSERLLPALLGSATGFMTLAAVDGVESELKLPAVDLTYGRAAGSIALGAISSALATALSAAARSLGFAPKTQNSCRCARAFAACQPRRALGQRSCGGVE